MASPSIREFARVDDAAIFIEDTFDADTVRSIAGASPSAVVMLSPQRLPVDADGHSPAKTIRPVDSQPTSYVSGVSDSARKRPAPHRLFGTDLSNSSAGAVGSATKAAAPCIIRPPGSRLSFSACTTPKDPRKSTSVGRSAVLASRRASSLENVSTEETQNELLASYVHIEEFEKLEKERNRYREMYRYQAQLCEELTKKEQAAQSALQEKIIEVIAISSRNEESKRFIRQMKKEMQDCKERALPFLNRKLDEIRIEQSLKEKYEAMLRNQEAIHESEKAEMEKEMGALEALLKDSKCAANLGKNSDSLLRASYLKNTRMFNDLYHTRRERDAEMERRLELEKQIEGLKKERREAEFALTKERRMHSLREEQLIEDVHVMHEEVMNLTSELLEMQIKCRSEKQKEVEEEEEYAINVEEEGSDEEYTPIIEDIPHVTSTPPLHSAPPPRPARRQLAIPQQ